MCTPRLHFLITWGRGSNALTMVECIILDTPLSALEGRRDGAVGQPDNVLEFARAFGCNQHLPSEHVALPTRWFANVTAILENDPNAKGIIVTREKEATLPGALRTCPDRSMALAEMDFGQEQVDLALRAVPHQLLSTRYEGFGSDLEGQWRRIFDWVGFWMPASLEPFEPRNSE